jgi:hypothetical protein
MYIGNSIGAEAEQRSGSLRRQVDQPQRDLRHDPVDYERNNPCLSKPSARRYAAVENTRFHTAL